MWSDGFQFFELYYTVTPDRLRQVWIEVGWEAWVFALDIPSFFSLRGGAGYIGKRR
jgi:hypothetical protein